MSNTFFQRTTKFVGTSPGYGPGGNAVPTPNIKEDRFVSARISTLDLPVSL